MTEGTNLYKGLALPAFGACELKNDAAANDVLTLTGYASQSGDFLVCQSENGTEVFVINSSGDFAGAVEMTSTLTVGAKLTVTAGGLTVTAGDITATAGDVVITNGYFLRFTSWPTTAPTTGLTLGDVFLQKTSTNAQIAICIDGSDGLRYVNTTSA